MRGLFIAEIGLMIAVFLLLMNTEMREIKGDPTVVSFSAYSMESKKVNSASVLLGKIWQMQKDSVNKVSFIILVISWGVLSLIMVTTLIEVLWFI